MFVTNVLIGGLVASDKLSIHDLRFQILKLKSNNKIHPLIIILLIFYNYLFILRRKENKNFIFYLLLKTKKHKKKILKWKSSVYDEMMFCVFLINGFKNNYQNHEQVLNFLLP